MHYNYHRSYSAALGAYTQADPIGLDGGGWNRFGYANQNAIMNSDIDGLKSSDKSDPKNPLDLEKICKRMSIPFDLENKPCKDSDECFENARKGLLSCNTSYWSPFSTGEKIACIECWKHYLVTNVMREDAILTKIENNEMEAAKKIQTEYLKFSLLSLSVAGGIWPENINKIIDKRKNLLNTK